MSKEIITKEVRNKLEDYKKEFPQNEITVPLVIITEVLAEISLHLENIVNKMYE